MKLFKNIDSYKATEQSVVTIGTFDGVHQGHQKILSRVTSLAKEKSLTSVLLTFFPHPRMVLQPETDLKLINTIEERTNLIEQRGIDQLIIHPFSKEFSRTTARDYVEKLLVNQLKAKVIVIGYDHRFGRNRAASIADLKEYAKEFSFSVIEISKQEIEEVAVSSTKIRNAIGQGNFQLANDFLNYNYSVHGKVVHGKAIGRTLGYPTANLEVDTPHKLLPKEGVYVTSAVLDNKKIYGMTNVGTNPTIAAGQAQSIETYFLDEDFDIYGKEITLQFHKRLRDELTFSNTEDLIKAMKIDEQNTKLMFSKLDKILYKQVDNSALIVFRILFGALLAIEGFGAITTGFVRRTFIEPEFTFTFIGFEFLEPLPGSGMYFVFALLGVAGLMVMVGYKYRLAIIIYAVTWTYVYLAQKSSYNNHYYLLMLLNYIMIFMPANKWASVDAYLNPSIKKTHMSRGVYIFIISFLWIVYTYAAVAKFYPDWLDGTFPRNLLASKSDLWLVGPYLQTEFATQFAMYYGLLFDLLIIPLLLWKRTRMFAFIAAVFFHLFNSIVLQIGIFPYLALAFTVFFFSSKTIHRLFLYKKPYYELGRVMVPSHKIARQTLMFGFLIVMVILPLRHWGFKGDVLWTEEGHRLSWRMMLRSRNGIATFRVEDQYSCEITIIRLKEYVTKKQRRSLQSKPDFMWQFAQRLKKEYNDKGREVRITAAALVSVNGKPSVLLLDPHKDLAAVEWHHFSHHDWIILY